MTGHSRNLKPANSSEVLSLLKFGRYSPRENFENSLFEICGHWFFVAWWLWNLLSYHLQKLRHPPRNLDIVLGVCDISTRETLYLKINTCFRICKKKSWQICQCDRDEWPIFATTVGLSTFPQLTLVSIRILW